MKLNIVPKIVLVVFIIFGIGVSFSTYFSFIEARDFLRNQELASLGDDVNKLGTVFMLEAFTKPEADVMFFADSDGIKDILYAISNKKNKSNSLASSNNYLNLKKNIEDFFYTTMKYRPNYYQIRLLGIRDNGKEIIRVNRKNGKIFISKNKDLQSKSDSKYFKEIIKLKEGEFYISDINLNREYGKIEKPYVPVFRIGSPVVSRRGDVLGVVIININFNSVIEPLKESPENISYFLAKGNGEYIFNTDESKTSKFDLGRGGNLVEDFKDLDLISDSGNQQVTMVCSLWTSCRDLVTSLGHVDKTYKEKMLKRSTGISFSHIYFDPLDSTRKFILGAAASYSVIDKKAILLRGELITISFFIMIVITLLLTFMTRYLLSPIKKLTKIATLIREGDRYVSIPNFGSDDLGMLAQSFKLMINAKNKSFYELQQSKEVLEKLGDGIITIDLKGIIIGFNQAAVDIFDYTKEEVIGKNVSILIPTGRHSSHHTNYLSSYLKTKNKKNVVGNRREVTALKKGEIKFPMEISIGEIEVKGEPVFIGSVRDITIKKRNEKILRNAKDDAEKATMAKAEFLARMSHEIRTPMNGIIGTASLIKDTDLNEKQKNYIKTIMSSGQSLLLIVNEILDFSSLEAGKIKIENQPFDVYHCIDEVYHLFEVPIQEKGIEINLKYSEDVPEFIIGDPGRIRQVVINLINNAMKFTNEGAISISISMCYIRNNDRGIKFSINDSGIGIPEAAQKKLFKAFSQVDTSSVRRTGGTGLGLSICKALVDLMEGRIGVESVEGEGSSFCFCIPLNVATDEDLAKLASKTIKDKNIIEVFNYDASVLIVEDVDVNRVVIIDMLEGYGCNIDYAVNGKIAVEMEAKKDYDIIFMDCQMPIMDGFESTKEIRKKNKDIPIIALTANVLIEEKKKCFDAGMNDFVSKPFTKEIFAPVLNKWLSEFIVSDKNKRKKIKKKKKKKDKKLKDYSLAGKIDLKAIEQFGDNAKKIIDLTFIDADDFMNGIEKAIADRNSEDLGLDAHSLKSVAAQVGGMRVSELAKILEHKGKGNKKDGLDDILSELKEEYIIFKKSLLEYINSNANS